MNFDFKQLFRYKKSVPLSAKQKVAIALNVLLVILAGLLGSQLFYPYERWWVAWFCLVPLFLAIRRARSPAGAGWLMFLFGVVFFGASLPWITLIFQAAAIGPYVLMSLPLVPIALIYYLAAKTHRPLFLVPLTALAWLAFEWVRCEGWYFQFSWAQLGFAFAPAPAGGVLYPWIGVYGGTLLIVLVNLTIAEIILARQRLPQRLILAALPVLALSLFLNTPAPSGIPSGTLRATMVQNETGGFDELRKSTLALKNEHPILVVWPEYALLEYPLSDARRMQELSQLAREMNTTLIFGTKEHLPANTPCDWMRRRNMTANDANGLYGNIALVLNPQGEVVGKYRKVHPIQFFADGVPGVEYPVFTTPAARIGVGICYDFDYASTALSLTKNGAEILAVPTFDQGDWSNQQHIQHSRMAQSRAAEVARWVVRTTSSGYSQIITPTGANAVTIDNIMVASASANVSPSNVMTIYTRYTHYLPQLAWGVMLLWLVVGVVRKRMTTKD